MYRVEWEPDATEQFAQISILHPNRWNDINTADSDIERKLKRDPLHYSDAVAEGLNRIVSEPLAVYFSIEGQTVVVEAVAWVDA